jgi:hypothetical protein
LQSPYGSGTTDSSGHFDVSGSAPVGAFYNIQVLKRRIGSNLVCRGAAAYGQFT